MEAVQHLEQVKTSTKVVGIKGAGWVILPILLTMIRTTILYLGTLWEPFTKVEL